jgi:hypothetical protein
LRHAARTDDCQQAIVEALRAIGVKVYVSKLPLDLLCAVRNPDGSWRTLLLECKDEDGRFSKQQSKFMAEWPGEIHVVRSPIEALKACLGRAMQ